jgi:hypothetical protein
MFLYLSMLVSIGSLLQPPPSKAQHMLIYKKDKHLIYQHVVVSVVDLSTNWLVQWIQDNYLSKPWNMVQIYFKTKIYYQGKYYDFFFYVRVHIYMLEN